MEKFEINILGCGSGVPTVQHLPSSQLLNIHGELFLVDCGEGCQSKLWKSGFKMKKLNHIFISHAHADHFFGLIPLLSSFRLMHVNKSSIHVYLPEVLKPDFEYLLEKYCVMPFEVIIHTHDGKTCSVIYEDKHVIVETIPLNHGIPCCGFLFKEKVGRRRIIPSICENYGIPYALYPSIIEGEDYVMPDGSIVANEELTLPNEVHARSYAYCSDTAYNPEMVPQIYGVDVLYHEATFLEMHKLQAEKSFHSTTKQAAEIARIANVGKLLIGHYSTKYAGIKDFIPEIQSVFPQSVAVEEDMVIEI